jgi:DNA-binding NtrC family response regulator
MSDTFVSAQLPLALFLDDDSDFLNEIRFVAETSGLCQVETLSESSRLLSELAQQRYAVLFMDWVMPFVTGSDLLPVISKEYPSLPVVVMTGISDISNAVRCMKQGAIDYLTKPLDANRFITCLTNALKISELSSQNRQLKEYLLGTPLEKPENFRHIITCSDKMQALFKLIETVAPSRYPVFITGETGVGKELIASAVHKASGLKGKFVPLNVAGLDPLMFDDTLFGHKKGAYTGASESREGLIGQAQGGTLFLDEIGDLSHQSQVKLLRLLQENEYYRLGSDLIQKSDARIVAASNRDFKKLLSEGKFREDLYHRLCYHQLSIPPLRSRKEDILLLVSHFAGLAAASVGKSVPCLSAELQFMLCDYDFPGNVRELVNRVSNAVVVNRSGLLTQEDFPGMTPKHEVLGDTQGNCGGQFSMHLVFPEFPTLELIEQIMINEALKRSNGRKGMAAELLGITRQTLRNRMEGFESA